MAGHDLTADVLLAAGLCAADLLGSTVVVGRDQRLSSPELADAFCAGLLQAGVRVLDVGMTTRGMCTFAGWRRGLTSAYVSASHLPPEWNGLKISGPTGNSFGSNEMAAIRDRVLAGSVAPAAAAGGRREELDIRDEYFEFVRSRLQAAAMPLRILVDCGNGTAGLAAPKLLGMLGFHVTALFEEPDGRFPNRPSEIGYSALQETARRVREHDLGVAYDGDCDRMTLITADCRVLDAEQSAAVILTELLEHRPGDIVANVGCGRIVDSVAAGHGRRVERVPVGTVFMLRKVREINAAFGMESSMHMCIPHVLPFDDAVAVSAYAAWAASRLESRGKGALAALLDGLPRRVVRKFRFEMPDAEKFRLMEAVREFSFRHYPNVSAMDGVRIEIEGGWVLVRPSDTSPLIRVEAEGDSEAAVEKMVKPFLELLNRDH